ncbi:MAG TPA: T9SS type A sorting domain-containing protein, partial [Panacibacter sp.]|nr:T9SS type A sorting domain-containing protein [Panacibacter sp.]
FLINNLCAGCNLTVNAGPDLTSCCPSNGTPLNAIASGGIAPYTYTWSPAAGLSNPNIANPICFTTGTFTVTVTDASGVCIASDAVTVTAGGISCCRLADGKNKSQAYPNPFNNGFTLKMPANAVADLQIVNLYGMPLEVKRKASGTVQMGSRLASGAYTLIVIYSDGTKEELKIIKSPQ